jgi:cytochrome P450
VIDGRTRPTAADVDLADFGLFDPAVQQCPHAYYARMQQDAPVYVADAGGVPLYLITRYEDVLEVVRDIETFSSRFDTSGMRPDSELPRRIRELYEAEGGYERIGTMLTVDPPEHTRYRRLVSKAFTPKVINDLEPAVREITTRLIDAFIDSPSIEFVERFAVPLPVTVIARALNVPDDRLADFKRWSDASIAGIGTNISIEERLDAEREVIEYQRYFADQLEQRRHAPQDDILTNLLQARIDKHEDGDVPDAPLTVPEMLSIIQQLLVAGNETTTKMLTEMMRLLGEHPDQWRALRADPGRARPVVEEALRLSTPTQGMFRVTTRPATVAGVDIPAGSQVVVMYSAANRDPAVFPAADDFDPDRERVTDHLAFGKGIHFCVGAALSRLEGKVAAEELSRRIERFTLAPTNDFEYHPSFMLRGLKHLDLDIVGS